MKLNKYLKYLLIVALWLQTGCMREKQENCFAELRLRFSYTLNNSGQNLFGEQVRAVNVYLFDQDGVLRAVAQEHGSVLTNDYVMQVDAEPGKYTVLAWGGGEEDLATSYVLDREATVGQTRLNDLLLLLRQGSGNQPHDNAFDDLFYGALGSRTAGSSVYVFEQVDLQFGDSVERTIELIKDTNTLVVTVEGLGYLDHYQPPMTPDAVLGLRVEASNGDCLYDNSILPAARSFVFKPMEQQIADQVMTTRIKLMRLDMERLTSNPMLLYIRNSVTGDLYPSNPIDVLGALKQSRSGSGALLYNNQEDFDREDEFHIKIRFEADLYVRVFVENWEIINLKPEI